MVEVDAKIVWNNAILDRLKAAAKVNSVEVGIPEDATYPNGQKVAEVALRQEFGTAKIPPRPFIRPTIDSRKGHWGRKIIEGTFHCFTEENFRAMFADLGKAMQVNFRQAIDRVREPPLSEYTKARRRARGNNSTKPLIDTGRMKDSIKFRVKGGDWEE